MQDFKMGVVERRFAEIIWANEPLSSGELVKKCAEELEWKKSTTRSEEHTSELQSQ